MCVRACTLATQVETKEHSHYLEGHQILIMPHSSTDPDCHPLSIPADEPQMFLYCAVYLHLI